MPFVGSPLMYGYNTPMMYGGYYPGYSSYYVGFGAGY